MSKKVVLPVILGLVIVLVLGAAGIAVAQTATPPAQGNAPATTAPMPGFGMGGFGNFNWAVFDAAAKALGMSPTDLFLALHSGKTLAQVAQEQNPPVPLATVQSAMQAAAATNRQNALSNWIDQAQQAGRITADQANWLRQGIANGFLNRPFPSFGNRFFGPMGRGRMGAGPRNFGLQPMPRMPRLPRQPGQQPQVPGTTATPSFQ